MTEKEEVKKIVADRCMKARKVKKLERGTVAIRLGCTYSTIRNIESGKYDQYASTIVKLSQLYGVSADYLLGLTNRPGGKIEYR